MLTNIAGQGVPNERVGMAHCGAEIPNGTGGVVWYRHNNKKKTSNVSPSGNEDGVADDFHADLTRKNF